MLSAPAFDFTFEDDDWNPPPHAPRLYRAASVGSWGVTSIGRGFDWDNDGNLSKLSERSEEDLPNLDKGPELPPTQPLHHSAPNLRKYHHHALLDSPSITPKLPLLMTAQHDVSHSPHRPATPNSQTHAREPGSPRPRRRSSQQRVSLIAGRVSIAPIEPPPSPPPMLSENLKRTPSSGSLLSNISTRPPSPSTQQSFLGGRSISDFFIEGEIGRGAYGLVKRAREIQADGSYGVSIPFVYFAKDVYTNAVKSRPLLSSKLSNHES